MHSGCEPYVLTLESVVGKDKALSSKLSVYQSTMVRERSRVDMCKCMYVICMYIFSYMYDMYMYI